MLKFVKVQNTVFYPSCSLGWLTSYKLIKNTIGTLKFSSWNSSRYKIQAAGEHDSKLLLVWFISLPIKIRPFWRQISWNLSVPRSHETPLTVPFIKFLFHCLYVNSWRKKSVKPWNWLWSTVCPLMTRRCEFSRPKLNLKTLTVTRRL